MSHCLKAYSRVSLLLLLVGCIVSISPSDSLAYQITQQVLDGGGVAWQSTANYKLCSSLGQPITGNQDGAAYDGYSGFFNPGVIDLTTDVEEHKLAHLPAEFSLSQNYPNPFNHSTIIKYALPAASQVRIRIYNILGQRVRNLVNEPQEEGHKTIHWDAKDDKGAEVSSGIYFYRMEAGDFVKNMKMILLK